MARKEKVVTDIIKKHVVLTGIKETMFDRYAGDNKTKLLWHQKIYLIPGTNIVAFPTINLISFLTAHNTNSAPKRLRDKRAYKDICNACLSFVNIVGCKENAGYIPFLRDGKPIEIGDFDEEKDSKSGIYIHRSVARLPTGIPNPKERPVLPLPWSMEFDIEILPNREIKEIEIKNLFEEGGMAIGLGTFRGVFGKFLVSAWE